MSTRPEKWGEYGILHAVMRKVCGKIICAQISAGMFLSKVRPFSDILFVRWLWVLLPTLWFFALRIPARLADLWKALKTLWWLRAASPPCIIRSGREKNGNRLGVFMIHHPYGTCYETTVFIQICMIHHTNRETLDLHPHRARVLKWFWLQLDHCHIAWLTSSVSFCLGIHSTTSSTSFDIDVYRIPYCSTTYSIWTRKPFLVKQVGITSRHSSHTPQTFCGLDYHESSETYNLCYTELYSV